MRVTNDREKCPARRDNYHLWVAGGGGATECHYCGTERVSRWIPTEADIVNNRKEQTP